MSSHGHLMNVMMLTGAVMVLVPIGIGVLVAVVVIRDRRKAAKQGGDGSA
jgi:hypothetical protein